MFNCGFLWCPHTPDPLSLTVNFSLYCCWGPAVSVFLTMVVTAGLFFSILKCKMLMRIEFRFSVSVLQGRCSLEIFGNVFVTTRSFFSNLIDITRGIKWSQLV